MASESAGATNQQEQQMAFPQQLAARELHTGDVIHFGGARAHVVGIRHEGALVVARIEELGASVTFDGAHPVTLHARPNPQDAERSAVRRLRTRETRLDGARNDSGKTAAAA
jgi:hypothetical protein